MKILSVRAELFNADRRTDTTELGVRCRNITNASKKSVNPLPANVENMVS